MCWYLPLPIIKINWNFPMSNSTLSTLWTSTTTIKSLKEVSLFPTNRTLNLIYRGTMYLKQLFRNSEFEKTRCWKRTCILKKQQQSFTFVSNNLYDLRMFKVFQWLIIMLFIFIIMFAFSIKKVEMVISLLLLYSDVRISMLNWLNKINVHFSVECLKERSHEHVTNFSFGDNSRP